MYALRFVAVCAMLQILNYGHIAASGEKTERSNEKIRILQDIQKRQRQRDEIFRKMKQNYTLDKSAKALVNIPVRNLIERLQLRNLTAVQVLQAYIAKALIVHDSLNCITEMVPFALETARELDTLKAVKGPLHGLPMCVKDDHDIKGMDSTLGLGKNLNKPATINSVLVQAYTDLGAVIFCKTNIPQTLCSFASHNPIYGETLNHRNVKLSPGGSSSGAASLVGGGAAVFASGTDIGGSVRIPAHFSGLCSIKPTQNRLSNKGILIALPKLIEPTSIPGILAKDVDTVAYVFKALTLNSLQNLYDARAPPIPWNNELYESKVPLKFGYYTSLSFFPAIGDTISTVLDAKNALEKLGYSVVPFKIENDWEIVRLMNDMLAVDFGLDSNLKMLFANEPPARGLEGLRATCGLPDWRRRLDFSLSNVSHPGTMEYSARRSLLSQSGVNQHRDRDVGEMMFQRNQLVSKLLTQMEEASLDLILAPAFPFPACRLRDTGKLFGAVEYTKLWSIVDFPAGVIPFRVESGKRIASYDDEGDSLLKLAKESTMESVGSPIGVQIIGKPFKEEMVLRAMRELYNDAKL